MQRQTDHRACKLQRVHHGRAIRRYREITVLEVPRTPPPCPNNTVCSPATEPIAQSARSLHPGVCFSHVLAAILPVPLQGSDYEGHSSWTPYSPYSGAAQSSGSSLCGVHSQGANPTGNKVVAGHGRGAEEIKTYFPVYFVRGCYIFFLGPD